MKIRHSPRCGKGKPKSETALYLFEAFLPSRAGRRAGQPTPNAPGGRFFVFQSEGNIVFQKGEKVLKKISVLSFLILLSFVPAAFAATDAAQEPVMIEQVQVTGSRLAEDIRDVPTPTYVLTREEIQKSGVMNIQEALARIPGVMGLTNGASATYSKGVSIRGLNTEVLLLVDGAPMMNASYGTGSVMGSPFDLRSIQLDLVERIEVVKGASSALYGSNAAGGVINVITRKGTKESGASLKLEGGNVEWFRGSVRGTAYLTSMDASVTVGYTRTQEGDVDIRLLPDGTHDRATDFRGNDYTFRFDKGPWSFVGDWGDYESKWDYTNLWMGTLDQNKQENDYSRFLLNYNDGVSAGRIYYQTNERKAFDLASSGISEYDDTAWGAAFNRRQELFGMPMVWGVDWRRETSEYTNRDNPWGNDIPYDLTRDGFAPYVEFSVPLGELTFDVGLRYEYWDVDDGDNVSELVPRFSLNWESPGGQLWYFTAGKFFSMPSFYQIFCPTRSMGSPNPNLKPEKGWSYDLGFKDLRARHPWSVGVFYMEMDDRIRYESDPVSWIGQYINLDKYRAWGLEAEVTFNLSDAWAYTQGVTLTKAEEKMPGASSWERSSMPRWDLSGRFNYAKGPWSGELFAHYLLDREIRNNANHYDNDNIFILDAAITWTQGRNSIKLACRNIFDKEYVLDSEGYIAQKRRFVLSFERVF